jgi:hypothetical protein
MTTEDINIQIFCFVDEEMKEIPKHPQAKLYPSELVTIGIYLHSKEGIFEPFIAASVTTLTLCFEGIYDNGKLCSKGTWNERMYVETALSIVTVICDLKHIYHRFSPYIQACLASLVVMFNVLLTLFHHLHPDADPFQMSMLSFTCELAPLVSKYGSQLMTKTCI